MISGSEMFGVFEKIDERLETSDRLFPAGRPEADGTGKPYKIDAKNALAIMMGENREKGPPTWAHVARESLFAALKDDTDSLRQRLTEHAAIVCLWLEEIERKTP